MKSLRERACDFLARREHSRLELARKLARHETDEHVVNALLDQLEKDKLLCNHRFARIYLRSRSMSGHGPCAIKTELAQRGIEDELFYASCELEQIDWDAGLFVAWQKKYQGRQPLAPRASQVRFLYHRGFELDKIYNLINNNQLEE